jgi:hypothetical protein
MLITTDFHDVPTKLAKNERPIRIFVISPKIPDYPQAKFPGMRSLTCGDSIQDSFLPLIGVVVFRLGHRTRSEGVFPDRAIVARYIR